jgi:hypothetical protein
MPSRSKLKKKIDSDETFKRRFKSFIKQGWQVVNKASSSCINLAVSWQSEGLACHLAFGRFAAPRPSCFFVFFFSTKPEILAGFPRKQYFRWPEEQAVST